MKTHHFFTLSLFVICMVTVSVSHGICYSSFDCGSRSYCAKLVGDCNGPGTCARRPEICFTLYDPVCGCDGRTYGNGCEAAAAGVNVNYSGQCMPLACRDNGDCDPDSYCAKTDGNCSELGRCTIRPTICPDVWDPVCGCDGQTYGNECEANAAGVNVDYSGQCVLSCSDNDDCGSDSYCATAAGDCDGAAICSIRPTACPDIWAPVCGCDGQTYGNECEANAVGVSVNYSGECLPPGPTILMMDPYTSEDGVHTGDTGMDNLQILWSEDVSYDSDDIIVFDEDGNSVPFTEISTDPRVMHINFLQPLTHDRYQIVVSETVVSTAGGIAIDGDGDGVTGGNAIIILEHRQRADFNNNNIVNLEDFAEFARKWLWVE